MSSWRLVLCLLMLACSQWLYAADEEGKDGVAVLERPIYIPIKPAFVVNYGGPGRLKYLKLDISLRAKDTLSSNAIRHHMPLIRDYMVREFSRLTDADVDTPQGKEAIREKVLNGVKELLKEENGEEGVNGLYFNSFVVQR